MSRDFFNKYIKKWFPKSNIIYISNNTSGAALSVLAGLSIASNSENEPIIIDLADIYFETDFIPYLDNENCGYAFAFKGKGNQYSYFELNKNKEVIRTVEKKEVSNYASAGVYAFPNCSKVLKSIAFALENVNSCTNENLFYVCPIMNYLIYENTEIKLIMVDKFKDYKI